jgi:hypothetical protein
MMKNYIWSTGSGRIEIEFPEEAIIDCFHQGRCDEDVEFWQEKLNLNLDRDLMISELGEYGAWSPEELNDLSDEELEQKLIWIGAGDLADSMVGDDDDDR